MQNTQHNHRATIQIIIGMTLGVLFALLYKYFLSDAAQQTSGIAYYLYAKGQWFDALGQAFMNLIKMLVMPVVFVSLVCGACDLRGMSDVGRIGGKTMALYLVTTALAIILALCIASLLQVGGDVSAVVTGKAFAAKATPLAPTMLAELFPANLLQAFANPKQMLQIVIFGLLFGLVLPSVGAPGEKLIEMFRALNEVLMKFMSQIVRLAPFGVCFLLAYNFSHISGEVLFQLGKYCMVLVAVLMLQLFGVYSLLIWLLARLNPLIYLRKMFPAMLFAFSVSSSSASIPVVLNTVKKKLGVDNRIAAFVIPIGATINMDGTAIMQGIATIFITNYFGHPLDLNGYIMVVLLATLASIGTAAVPSAGLVTLIMILSRFLTPVQITEGIALIYAVDRLLDMLRTAVNVAGDAMVACVVAKSEKRIALEVFNDAN